MGVNSLPKTVTRQSRDCNLNPGPSAPESSIQHANHSVTKPTCVVSVNSQSFLSRISRGRKVTGPWLIQIMESDFTKVLPIFNTVLQYKCLSRLVPSLLQDLSFTKSSVITENSAWAIC